MKTFRQYLLEIKGPRTPKQAIKLLDRIKNMKSFAPIGREPNGTMISNLSPGVSHLNNFTHNGHDIYRDTFAEKGHTRMVPLNTIVSQQNSVGVNVLKDKIKGKYKEHGEPVLMIHHNGVHYAMDGNHRISRHKLLNKTHIKAKVVDADE